VRNERAATVLADEEVDYFLRRPRTLATHTTVQAMARGIARCATQPPSTATAGAQGQPTPAATAQAPVRPIFSTTAQALARPGPSAAAEAPGQPGTRPVNLVPLLPARPLAAPFAN
jgi:hypothetical protein